MNHHEAYIFTDDCGQTICGNHDRTGERVTIVTGLRDDYVIKFADGSTSHAYRRELTPAAAFTSPASSGSRTERRTRTAAPEQ